jgi:hypothetical protein
VGPRAVLDAVVKRKIPSHYQELNPNHPAHYTNRAITARLINVEISNDISKHTPVIMEASNSKR